MSLNAQALRLLAEKGLTADDIVELAEALEVRRDPTAADRMRRYRARKNEREQVTRNVTANPSPNDNILTPPDPSSASADAIPTDFSDEIVSAWNAEAKANGLAEARKLNPARRKHLAARVREHGKPAVFEAIRKLMGSDWHCGRTDRGTWRADLGWLLKSPENFQKILELPAEQAQAPPASPADQAASCERSADLYDKMGRSDDAAEFRKRASEIRQKIAA